MRFYQIGFALTVFVFLTPAFASQCPSADDVRSCHGEACAYQRLPGWSTNIFYTDQGKPFSFLKSKVESTEHGARLSCYYTYIDPENNKAMPPALVLRTTVN